MRERRTLARSVVSLATAICLLTGWVGTGRALAQADLTVGDDAAKPATGAEVAIWLTTGPGATAVQLDLQFDPAKLDAGLPVLSAGLGDHVLSSVEPAPGKLRIVIHSPTNALLPLGQLVRVPLAVAAGATPGLTPLDPNEAEVATPAAVTVLPLALDPGSVHVYTLEADLALSLGADRGLVADGDLLTYTLAATNPGPDPVTGLTVADPAPAELTGVTWTCTASGGATCTPAGASDINDLVSLPVTGTATYTIQGTVDTMAAGFDNTADLTNPVEVYDPNLSDNDATASVGVCSVDDLVLTAYDIGGIAVFNACVTLTAGPTFNIQGTGEVTLQALESVVLLDGFSVQDGGRLTVVVF